jgi:glucosyl-3-phosphoglycerate synthase
MALTTLHHSEYPAARLAAERELSISICLPARDEAATIGPILRALMPLVGRGAVDEVVVVDDSTDGTAEVARALGAVLHEQSRLMPELGPALGKGDAMWRSLSVLRGDVVCFLDADSEDLGEHFACGLAGPVACGTGLEFAKGFYRRPFRVGGTRLEEGGGRVTELTARPLLELFYPELSAFVQPLAGEMAARRELLERLPFATGYAVDVALLIDAWRQAGPGGLCQVDLDVRQNRHRPLAELGPMAREVMLGVLSRAQRDGLLQSERPLELVERPPLNPVPTRA